VREWRAGAPTHDDDTLLVISRELDDAPARPGAERAAANGAGGGTAALALLARARSEGRTLTLPAEPAVTPRIERWLTEVPELEGLTERAARLVRLAVIEACQNVIEHSYGAHPRQSFDLGWVPERPNGTRHPHGPGGARDPARPAGSFVLRDRGAWKPPDLSDPEVRKRGRGLGLAIVHRVMSRVEYHPGTPEGNLTILTLHAD